MRSSLAIAVLALPFFIAGTASAAEYLHHTDTLPRGMMSMFVEWQHREQTAGLHDLVAQRQGRAVERETAVAATVAAGVTDRLEVGIRLPYLTDSTDTFAGRRVGDRLGDYQLLARYALASSSCVAGIDVTPGGYDRSGSEVRPYIALSTPPSVVHRPYLLLGSTLRGGGADDSHGMNFGLASRIATNAVIDVGAEFALHLNSDQTDSYRSAALSVTGRIGLSTKVYLVPSAAVTYAKERSSRDGRLLAGEADGYRLGLGVYSVF